ncbi:MAG: class I SAM-dependent methyltransferase [Thermoanaerobaculia bacterium]
MNSELERIAAHHDQTQGFTPRLIECRANTLESVLSPGRILDLGCADGLLTWHLAQYHSHVLALDASALRVERTRARVSELGNVDVVQSKFEEFDPGDDRFDAIVMSCILEHVSDPPALLRHVVRWLSDGGKIVAIVPNARSLHRRAGVRMGMLADLAAAGHTDHELGHHEMYTLEILASHFREAGLVVVETGGHLIKPLPNDQMCSLDPKLLSAFEAIGHELPDLSAEIFAVGSAS